MGYYMLETCGLSKLIKMSKLDELAFIVAAVCHDLGHDGFTNSYHSNAITSRAIDSNDISVQETYHTAEFFRILQDEDLNFLSGLSKEEFKLFRKRSIGLILATDMAKHSADLSSLNALLDNHSVANGENLDKLIEIDDANALFKYQ